MDNNTPDIELMADKQKAEELLNKEALSYLYNKQNEVPVGYFEGFDTKVLHKINVSKKNRIIDFSTYKPYLMAAAITLLIATTYIFLQGEEKNTDYAKVNMQDIPTEEIDSYVNENETLAEIDWQSEINTVGMAIDNETGDNLIQDSNTKQN